MVATSNPTSTINNPRLGLQIDTPPEPRIQRHLQPLQLLAQIAQPVLQPRHLGVDLRGGRGQQRLGLGEGELEEGVADFVPPQG